MVLSSPTDAVLVRVVTPAGSGETTFRAKAALPPAPLIPSGPMTRAQTVPAPDPPAQVQPGVLAPRLKVVLAGTVSASTTPVSAVSPALL
jgi:hypothetical protein